MNITETNLEILRKFLTTVIVWKFACPLMIAFGTVTNVLCIWIFCKKKMQRVSVSAQLIVLAVTDLLVLYVVLTPKWFSYMHVSWFRSSSSVVCKLHMWLSSSLLQMSSWIVVLVSLDRFCFVFFPLHPWTLKLTNKKFSLVKIFCVWLLMLAIDLHYLYGFGEVYDAKTSRKVTNCGIQDEAYYTFVMDAWLWIDTIVLFYLPFTILLICNSCILCKLHKKYPNTASEESNSRQVSGVRMVLALNFVFFFTTFPAGLLYLRQAEWTRHSDVKERINWYVAWSISNLVMYANNCINIFSYLASSPLFRKELSAVCLETVPEELETQENTLEMR